MTRAVSDLKKSAAAHAGTAPHRTRPELQDRSSADWRVVFICMMVLYYHLLHGHGAGGDRGRHGHDRPRLLLRGRVGQPGRHDRLVEQPDLRPDALDADHRRAADGRDRRVGHDGVAAVLGVAAVVCVSSAVAGEMLQDLKVGHILGRHAAQDADRRFHRRGRGEPGAVLPAALLHQGNINSGGIGFGDREAVRAAGRPDGDARQGIVGGDMAWPLVVVGILMGIALIMFEVKSPMLFAVGMYLPLETTFAIFVGGVIRWITDTLRDRRGFNDAQKARIENAGVLIASGFIAGEALMGIVIAVFKYKQWPLPVIFAHPNVMSGFIVLVILGVVMVRVPLANAGRPDEPAPPTAIM